MKKVIGWFLIVSFALALFLALTNGENWSWRSYFENVTKNIEPLPRMNLTLSIPEEFTFIETIGAFFTWLGDLLYYPIDFVLTLLHNFAVILDGFLPFDFSWSFDGVGESGGGNSFGGFGGGGFGGGGGGIR